MKFTDEEFDWMKESLAGLIDNLNDDSFLFTPQERENFILKIIRSGIAQGQDMSLYKERLQEQKEDIAFQAEYKRTHNNMGKKI